MSHQSSQVWAILLGFAVGGMRLIAADALVVESAGQPDCLKVSQSVRVAVVSNLSNLLEIVSKEVAASPACSCEIVKAAIEGSGANAEMVASIVVAAATASPENMWLIAQCAIATVPDSLAQVKAVLAKLDPKADEGDNPLDFPGEDPYGRVSIGGDGEGGTEGGTDGGTLVSGGSDGGGTFGGGTFGGGTFGGGFFGGGGSGGGIGGFSSGGGGFNFTGGNSGGGGGGGGGGIAPIPTTNTNPGSGSL